MKGIRSVSAALFSVAFGLASGGFAAEKGTVRVMSPWQGSGQVYEVGPDKRMILGRYAGIMYIEDAEGRLMGSEPKRGDVVVFRYPVDPKVNFIKRLVGQPGDTITYRNKELFVNGERVETVEQGFFTSRDVKCSTPAADALLLEESVGEVTHDILVHTRTRGRDGRWVVPEGHYFVMGDNRDRSNDSREWGFVPEDHLMGRAVGIWLNFDYKKGCGDLSRIGDGIR